MKKHHTLKCVQPYFDEIRKGDKTFMVRINDRDYKEGDYITLVLYDTVKNLVLDEKIHAEIGYVLTYSEGLKEGWCVFSLVYVSTY